jgi:opacity protein-like surface antigen
MTCSAGVILRRDTLALVLAVLLLPAAARAERELVVTPFAGVVMGGSLRNSANDDVLRVDESAGFGVVVDLLESPRAYYELVYSFQRSGLEGIDTSGWPPRVDLDLHYLHVGGRYEFPRERVRPFIAAGLGLTALVPDGAGLGSSTHFSLSLGGGVSLPVSARVALRLEVRGYLTVLSDSTGIFCASSGGQGECAAGTQGDSLGQVEVLAGVSFRWLD